MKLKEFKLIKNRQAPEICFSYEKYEGNRKFSIFTMNACKTFLASIEEKRMDKRYYSEFSETHNSVDECLFAFDNFLNAL